MKRRLSKEELANAHDGMCGQVIGDGPCGCLVHYSFAKGMRETLAKHMPPPGEERRA